MPKWIKNILWICFLMVTVIGGVYFFYFNDPIPQGNSPAEADELARHMLDALHYNAYKETRYLEWSYRSGKNRYRWDKVSGTVEMSWKSYTGIIDLVSPEKSIVKENDIPIQGEQRKKLTQEAISIFNNDSFWLVAPFKIFDKGTERGLVVLDNGKTGLLVTYTQGGDTPGDTYLWELDEQNIPIKFRMWVQILPLKGLGASWEGWHETQAGALLPQYHKVGPFTLDLGAVRAYR